MNPVAFKPVHKEAFSLIEIMVTVTLLALIILALVQAFSVTQKAMVSGLAQTDSMAGGRLASEMIARETEQMTLRPPKVPPVFTKVDFKTNYWALPQNATLTNILSTVFFDFQDGGFNRLVNYQINPDVNGVGDLMRYEDVGSTISTNQIIQGVVSFRMIPIFGSNGVLLTDIISTNVLPSCVQMELAILEDHAYRQYLAISKNPIAARQFLTNQAGHLHIFRQRISIKAAQP